MATVNRAEGILVLPFESLSRKTNKEITMETRTLSEVVVEVEELEVEELEDIVAPGSILAS